MIVKILQKNRLFLSCLSGPGIIGKYVYLSPLVILVSRLTLIPLTPELRSKYFTTWTGEPTRTFEDELYLFSAKFRDFVKFVDIYLCVNCIHSPSRHFCLTLPHDHNSDLCQRVRTRTKQRFFSKRTRILPPSCLVIFHQLMLTGIFKGLRNSSKVLLGYWGVVSVRLLSIVKPVEWFVHRKLVGYSVGRGGQFTVAAGFLPCQKCVQIDYTVLRSSRRVWYASGSALTQLCEWLLFIARRRFRFWSGMEKDCKN